MNHKTLGGHTLTAVAQLADQHRINPVTSHSNNIAKVRTSLF
jgi:hypothetical protein